jgi:predicted metal-dependent peptidase
MSDHDRRNSEVTRIQQENDLLGSVPNDTALALAQEGLLIPGRVATVLDLKRQGLADGDIVAHEKEWLDKKAAKWDLDREAVSWIQCSIFLAEFSRWIRKRSAERSAGGLQVGTAAAIYNSKTEEIEIVYNPRFMASVAGERQGNGVEPHSAGINEHEHFHLMLQHVTARRRDPHSLWNIATDLAINSLIARGDTPSRLPSMVLLPGIMHKGPVDPKQPKEVKEAREKLSKIIAALPQEQASEWYFNKLKSESEKEGYSWGKKGMKIPGAPKPGEDGEGDEGWTLFPSDEHGGWDDIPDELRDIVEGKIKHALRKAAQKADGSPSGWGNIPSELREEIRAYAFGSVDWKSVLRNFCGNLRTGERSRSIKRVDRRFPYVHPGLKRGRNPSVLVLVDQSGSVSDEVLSRFFGALDGLSRKMTFDVVPFDHTVAAADKFEWKRGQKPKLARVRGGGTSFDAAIEYANDPRNRGKWEGVIMLTDGECSQPRACRNKLCYVIAPGHKLLFKERDGEMVVQMTEKDKDGKGGGW